jgi:hypothetical protein
MQRLLLKSRHPLWSLTRTCHRQPLRRDRRRSYLRWQCATHSSFTPFVNAAEDVLELNYTRHQCTLLRMDAGGCSLDDLNWYLACGYQLHCKDISSKRAEAWAARVQEWFDGPSHLDRQFGWVIPGDSLDYLRPVKGAVSFRNIGLSQ